MLVLKEKIKKEIEESKKYREEELKAQEELS